MPAAGRRASCPTIAPEMADELEKLTNSLRRLGVRGTALLLSQRLGLPLGRKGGSRALRVRRLPHALICRAGTSDVHVFSDVFLHDQYAPAADFADVGLIIDCGANVGYTSAYFLSRYPNAELIAVEPDPDNFELLQANTQFYGERVITLRSAVWSHRAKLAIAEKSRGRGEEWGRQVTETDSLDDASVMAVSIGELLRDSGHSRISILKMDIEGAEQVVFSEGYESWLPKVDNLLIELHDDDAFPRAREAFHDALAGEDFLTFESGELTVCRRGAS